MKKFWNHTAIKIFLLFAVVFLAEIFIFNFRHWTSSGNNEITGMPLKLGSGYWDNGNGTYTVTEGELEIEIANLDDRLDTSFIDISVLNRAGDEIRPVTISQYVTDESHMLYYGLPEREIWENEKRSHYMTYHLYGKGTGLIIVPNLSIGQIVSFTITLNPVIPLFFSWERIGFIFLVMAGVYALRPSSKLHDVSYMQLNYTKKILLITFFLIHMVLFWKLTTVNPYFQEEQGDNQKQYQALTEALKEGSFSLLYEPAETLKQMDNPYDYDYRVQKMNEAGEWFKWDHVYFDGKYYVYFGVVPAVLFYLPYYLVTGVHLHNYVLIYVLSLLFLVGVLGTMNEMIRKWFPKTSLAIWMLLTELILMGSGIVYMTKRPDLYTVPILAGLSFGMLGLWCFLLADSREGISCRYLVAGALFTALIAGCRPQLFVFVLFSFILFGKYLMPSKGACLKGKKLAAIAYIVPMLAVASALMYYNKSRFGSVFDFGANYNLTFNDMRRRGWEWDRIPLGVVAYLFQPIKLIMRFPFMEAVYFDSQYMGVTIQEATYGGVYMSHLFAWFSLIPVLFHKQLKKYGKTPWAFSVAGLLMAAIVMMADTNMSGILQRYFSDFSIFIMISSAVSVLLMLCHKKIAGSILERIVVWGLILCVITEIGYQGMAFFLDTGEALKDLRPDLYSHFKYIAAFWL